MNVLDITNITSAVNRYKGLAKPSLFVVNITPPPSLGNDPVAKDLIFFTNNASLPGASFTVEQYRVKGYGLNENRVTDVNFDDVSCNFFVDNQGAVQSFFQKWAQKIMNFDANLSKSTADGIGSEVFAYPADTWATIDITHYTTAEEPIHTYTLSRAIPKSISSISLGWEINDQVMLLPVTFGYKSWSTKTTAANAVKYDAAHDAVSAARDKAVRTSYSVNPTPSNPPPNTTGGSGSGGIFA